MYTALYLYIRPAPCTKEPCVEGDRKTVRTNTKKRHFRVDLANVSHFANTCFYYRSLSILSATFTITIGKNGLSVIPEVMAYT